jgi:hypothetical protein
MQHGDESRLLERLKKDPAPALAVREHLQPLCQQLFALAEVPSRLDGTDPAKRPEHAHSGSTPEARRLLACAVRRCAEHGTERCVQPCRASRKRVCCRRAAVLTARCQPRSLLTGRGGHSLSWSSRVVREAGSRTERRARPLVSRKERRPKHRASERAHSTKTTAAERICRDAAPDYTLVSSHDRPASSRHACTEQPLEQQVYARGVHDGPASSCSRCSSSLVGMRRDAFDNLAAARLSMRLL